MRTKATGPAPATSQVETRTRSELTIPCDLCAMGDRLRQLQEARRGGFAPRRAPPAQPPLAAGGAGAKIDTVTPVPTLLPGMVIGDVAHRLLGWCDDPFTVRDVDFARKALDELSLALRGYVFAAMSCDSRIFFDVPLNRIRWCRCVAAMKGAGGVNPVNPCHYPPCLPLAHQDFPARG